MYQEIMKDKVAELEQDIKIESSFPGEFDKYVADVLADKNTTLFGKHQRLQILFSLLQKRARSEDTMSLSKRKELRMNGKPKPVPSKPVPKPNPTQSPRWKGEKQ